MVESSRPVNNAPVEKRSPKEFSEGSAEEFKEALQTQEGLQGEAVSNSLEQEVAAVNPLLQQSSVINGVSPSVVEANMNSGLSGLNQEALLLTEEAAPTAALTSEVTGVNTDSLSSLNSSEVSTSVSAIDSTSNLLKNFSQENSNFENDSFPGELVESFDGFNSAGQKVEGTKSQFAEILTQQVGEKIDINQVKQSNLDNIIQEARGFARDGGGQMQIKLNPEGLGQLDLRVDVQNGQVNVEILTDNQVTKTLFEDSMADIKTALEGHSLRVEGVKVDINAEMEKHFTNGQMDMMERDFAKGFLGQFSDDRQFFRNQMVDANFEGQMDFSESEPTGLSPAQRSNVLGQKRLNIFA